MARSLTILFTLVLSFCSLHADRPIKVTFATAVWEKDWRHVLLEPDYLRVLQIENNSFPFAERLLVINNVKDLEAVKRAAAELVEQGVLTRFVIAGEIAEDVFSFFQLKKTDFRLCEDAQKYPGVTNEWLYYNALAPLTAIYACQGDYLLYCTGDTRVEKPVDWIGSAIEKMERNGIYKVANLTWNYGYHEALRESYRDEGDFYVAHQGFSDQQFLVKKDDFRAPIYGEIRTDSAHYPLGDIFEKRVFSYMKNHGWERLIFKYGSYKSVNLYKHES